MFFFKLFCSIIRNLHLTLCPRVYMYLNIDDIHNLAYTPWFLTIQRFKVVYINGYIDVLYTCRWSFVSFQCFVDWVFPFMSPRGFVPLFFYMIVQQKINIDRNENQARGNIRGRVILFWNKDIPLYYMQSTTDSSIFSGLSTLKKWTLRAGKSIFLYGQKKFKVKDIVLQSINKYM